MLTNVPTEDLLQKRQGLDNLAMMSTLNGVDVPDSMMAELSAIEDELSRRGVDALTHDAWSNWIGKKIDEFRLQHFLSESPYALVFSATHLKTQEQAVFKIARAFKSTVKRAVTAQPGCFRIGPAGFEAAELSCHEVISRQIDQLNSVSEPSVVAITGSGTIENRQYYRMPQISGQSLRQLIDLGKFPADMSLSQTFAQLAEALRSLEGKGFRHRNLTAEHVIIRKGDAVHAAAAVDVAAIGAQVSSLPANSGVTLLSPGFGPSLATEASPGPHSNVEPNIATILTTQSYYPRVDGNDLLALGILLWEAITLHHPFEPTDEKELVRPAPPRAVQALGLRFDSHGHIDTTNYCRDYTQFIATLQNPKLAG
jgi:serine/threonine protein kinase